MRSIERATSNYKHASDAARSFLQRVLKTLDEGQVSSLNVFVSYYGNGTDGPRQQQFNCQDMQGGSLSVGSSPSSFDE